MTRARESAGYTVRQVEEIMFPHISKSALIRLEAHQEMPTWRKDRARAALVLLLYGFALDDFGLSEADIPPAIDYRALQQLRVAAGQTAVTDNPGSMDNRKTHSYQRNVYGLAA